MNWIILVIFAGFAYTIYRRQKKKPKDDFTYPDEPPVCFYLLVARPYLDGLGGNLGLNEIRELVQHNCDANKEEHQQMMKIIGDTGKDVAYIKGRLEEIAQLARAAR